MLVIEVVFDHFTTCVPLVQIKDDIKRLVKGKSSQLDELFLLILQRTSKAQDTRHTRFARSF